MIPVLLSGHAESQGILPASSWLLSKYAPEWEPFWLSYGAYHDALFSGTYVALHDSQPEGARAWARDLRRYIQDAHPDTEFLVLGLDDFLLAAPVDHEAIDLLVTLLERSDEIAAARLCEIDSATLFRSEISYAAQNGRRIIRLAKDAPYTVTAQYTLWRTAVLLELLSLPQVDTPWRFEVGGTEWLTTTPYQVVGLLPPPMHYPDTSALSARWPGVRVTGNPPEDVAALIALGLLPTDLHTT